MGTDRDSAHHTPVGQRDRIIHDHHGDGIDRRGVLKCLAWAGTGLVLTMGGGVLTSCGIGQAAANTAKGDFTFAQISDSHIGFSKEGINQDVTATFREGVATFNALAPPPAFLLHTGDRSHLATPEEFDTGDQVLTGAKAGRVFSTPGEHDIFSDNGASYRARSGKGTTGNGWQRFDYRGGHVVGLVNGIGLKDDGLGNLGQDQLDWLQKDVAGLAASTPIVVFAHVPLWAIYPQWGRGTDDSEQALGLLQRFGSVSVLNGPIHQVVQTVEGNVTFHTALATAFPQPAPGTAASPGPLKVAADQLRGVLGVTSVHDRQSASALAIIDTRLG